MSIACKLTNIDNIHHFGLSNEDWEDLPVQMVVVSAGIKPRDDLARDTDIVLGERGGIVVDEQVR